jgi:hypothetical protein
MSPMFYCSTEDAAQVGAIRYHMEYDANNPVPIM